MKYIVYCRKSTDEKDKQVLSIDQQIAELKEFSQREHLEVIDFIIEAKTAKVPGREQFANLLRRIEKGEAQGIISWHPDRLARNSIDGGRIIYLLDTGKLRNRFYIGILKYDGEYYQASHPCFISKQVFQDVQKQVTRIEKPQTNGLRFAFAGLARCGECNATITAESHTKYYKLANRKATYIYYRCTKKLKPCTQQYITEPELEKQVRNILASVALPKTWGKQWYEWLDRDEKEEKLLAGENITKLKAEVESLDRKLNILLDSYLDQVIDSETYKQKKNELFEEKIKITEEIEKIKTDDSAWLEPMREFVNSALQCEKIARANNTNEELAFFLKTVGSNFFLANQQLSPVFNRGFATVFSELGSHRPFRDLALDSFSVGPRGVEPLTFTMSM